MKEIAELMLERFFEQRDAYAIQQKDGSYRPRREPVTIDLILAHLRGDITLGNYPLSSESKGRFIGWDIDLATSGKWLRHASPENWIEYGNPRDVWANPNHPARPQVVRLLRKTSLALAEKARHILGVDVAITYSGSKGFHVYAWTGTLAGSDLFEIGHRVVQSFRLGPDRCEWEILEGRAAYKDMYGRGLEIEVFPKQRQIPDGGLGNLMRVPLGVHRKSGERPFFMEPYVPRDVMEPIDPLKVLKYGLDLDEIPQ